MLFKSSYLLTAADKALDIFVGLPRDDGLTFPT